MVVPEAGGPVLSWRPGPRGVGGSQRRLQCVLVCLASVYAAVALKSHNLEVEWDQQQTPGCVLKEKVWKDTVKWSEKHKDVGQSFHLRPPNSSSVEGWHELSH